MTSMTSVVDLNCTTTPPSMGVDDTIVVTDETFITEFNKRLPCKIRFNRSAQVEGLTPGLNSHTGWLVRITQLIKTSNSKQNFEFEVAFLDPISVDKRTKMVSVVPYESRQWKLFSLCAFAHTCYWNWDEQGRVSSGSIYTCSPYANVDIEVEKDKYVRLSTLFSAAVYKSFDLSKFPLKDEQFPVSFETLCQDRPSCRRKLPGRGQVQINFSKQHFSKNKYFTIFQFYQDFSIH